MQQLRLFPKRRPPFPWLPVTMLVGYIAVGVYHVWLHYSKPIKPPGDAYMMITGGNGDVWIDAPSLDPSKRPYHPVPSFDRCEDTLDLYKCERRQPHGL